METTRRKGLQVLLSLCQTFRLQWFGRHLVPTRPSAMVHVASDRVSTSLTDMTIMYATTDPYRQELGSLPSCTSSAQRHNPAAPPCLAKSAAFVSSSMPIVRARSSHRALASSSSDSGSGFYLCVWQCNSSGVQHTTSARATQTAHAALARHGNVAWRCLPDVNIHYALHVRNM